MATVRAFLGLGSNLGDRDGNLRRALAMLDAREGITVVRVSSFIETEPVGGPEGQPRFVNAAAAVDTTLAPRELLRACQEVERALGRERGPDEVRWGPRTIDIDILLYGEQEVDEPGLRIPHPRMHEREFVLVPLAQIAPEVGPWKSTEDVVRELSEHHELETVDLDSVEVPREVISTVEAETARRLRFVPMGYGAGTIKVAVADPLDLLTLDEIRFALHRSVEAVLAEPDSLDRALDKYYGPAGASAAERN